ncbi:hypothetical protein, partial [Devosia sp.]|uniref:hypothetical protein n=1 Tax=Devosia sp. TaxID=1871048 RepID=UPI001AC11778
MLRAVAPTVLSSPLEGEGARRVTEFAYANFGWDEGYFVVFTNSSAEERVPLTLNNLLNADYSVPLPQGA